MTSPPETPETVALAAPAADAPAAEAPVRYAHPLELGTMAVVVAGDQLTKVIIRQVLPLGESRSIIPKLLDLNHVHNTGAGSAC